VEFSVVGGAQLHKCLQRYNYNLFGPSSSWFDHSNPVLDVGGIMQLAIDDWWAHKTADLPTGGVMVGEQAFLSVVRAQPDEAREGFKS
jgi:hypothetical protein